MRVENEEVTITMSRKLWGDLLIDLDWLAQELDEKLGNTSGLEPGSLQVILELENKGVNH